MWCSFVFAFFGFLRKSNLVPRSLAAFDSVKHISRGSIAKTAYGLCLSINWSKTNQYQERVLQLPLVSITGHILDPVWAFENMCKLAPGHSKVPAFSYRSGNGTLNTVTYSQFTRELLSRLGMLGLDATKFGGHSFRRRGCIHVWAFRAGVSAELLKYHGDWRSMCYLRYLDFSVTQRLLVTEKMAFAIQTL